MGKKTKLFHHDQPPIGIDIGQTGIKVVFIDEKKWKVLAYGSIDLDPGKLQSSLNGNGDYIVEKMRELLDKRIQGKLRGNQVAISVPTNRTYSRTLSIPLDAENHLDEAMQLEAEQYIPVPASELNIDYQVIERTPEGLNILMSAVPRKLVDALVSIYQRAELDVVFAEPAISSVARLLTKTEEGHLPTIIIDIGASSTDVAILDKTVRATGGVNVGGNSFTLALSKKLKLSLEQAHQMKVIHGLAPGEKRARIESTLEPLLNSIADEAQKLMRYYAERVSSERKIEQILLVGGGSNVPGLGDYFTNHMIMPARVASPWQVLDFGNLPQPSRQFKPRYITATGLACIKTSETHES